MCVKIQANPTCGKLCIQLTKFLKRKNLHNFILKTLRKIKSEFTMMEMSTFKYTNTHFLGKGFFWITIHSQKAL